MSGSNRGIGMHRCEDAENAGAVLPARKGGKGSHRLAYSASLFSKLL